MHLKVIFLAEGALNRREEEICDLNFFLNSSKQLSSLFNQLVALKTRDRQETK
jgi:hypothetical protein